MCECDGSYITTYRLWVDDVRKMEDYYQTREGYPWTSCTSSAQALKVLQDWQANGIKCIDYMSLDHDLGGEDTTRRIILWMIDHNFKVRRLGVHTSNPVGAEWLLETAKRYKVSQEEPVRVCLNTKRTQLLNHTLPRYR